MTEIGERVSSGREAVGLKAGEERRTLAVACGAHALHDGYSDLVYLMLPIWQAEFGLAYSAVGALRALFSGTMAAMQIPSTLLAERTGVAPLLAAGTALAGFGYVVAGMSGSLTLLAAALLIGGLGSSTQHPLASALVARAFAGNRALKALGSYNFAGDIGKMALPLLAAVLIAFMPWRGALSAIGACGKLVCAFIGARIGVFATVLLTELLTALTILALLPLPLTAGYALLPLLGIALNGTSSVLYGSVPVLVRPERRERAFGVFYTGTIGSGALSPILYGLVGDVLGVPATLALVAAIVLATLPLAVALRPSLARMR